MDRYQLQQASARGQDINKNTSVEDEVVPMHEALMNAATQYAEKTGKTAVMYDLAEVMHKYKIKRGKARIGQVLKHVGMLFSEGGIDFTAQFMDTGTDHEDNSDPDYNIPENYNSLYDGIEVILDWS